MKTLEKVNQLSEDEILSLYQGFSGFLMNKTNVDSGELIKNIPSQLKEVNDLCTLIEKEIDDLDIKIKPNEVIPLAKVQLTYWATDEVIAPILEEYMNTNKIQSMAAGTILLVGAVLITTLLTTSLKIERKDGKTNWSFDSSNISPNAVNLVNAILTSIPESIKSLLTKK